MSNVKSQQQPESFTSVLDIRMVSTKTFEETLDTCANTGLVVAAIGDPGIGKTAIPKQVAKRRNAPYVPLHLPTMSIEDFHVPTSALDTKEYYDRRIQRRFQPLFKYVEEMRKENGCRCEPNSPHLAVCAFPEGRNPILAIEELNRAPDKAVTRAAFTVLDDRMIGDVHLDPAIQIVVTMNPSGRGMMVNEFEKDQAQRRRLHVLLGVSCNYGEFMQYARGAKFHPKVLEHLEAQPTLLYDYQGALSGKKFACPASWETMSTLCKALDDNKVAFDAVQAQAVFAGCVGGTAAEMFLEYVKDNTVVISPEDVLRGYSPTSTVRQRFKDLVAKSNLDKVRPLVSNVVVKLLSDTKRKPATFAKQLSLFLHDMGEEMVVAFIHELNEFSKTAKDGKRFVIETTQLLIDEPAYLNAVEAMQRAQQKGKAEAEKV